MGNKGQRRDRPLWTAYAVAFLITYFFYAGVFAQMPLWGVCVPYCIPIAVAYVAVFEGSYPGAVFGLCVGAFACIAQSGAGAGMIFGATLIGTVAGMAHERRHQNTPPLRYALLAALTASVSVEFLRVFARLLFGTGAGALTLLRIGTGELIYSLLLALPTYPLFRLVSTKFANYN